MHQLVGRKGTRDFQCHPVWQHSRKCRL
jgi:hypothetical protein